MNKKSNKRKKLSAICFFILSFILISSSVFSQEKDSITVPLSNIPEESDSHMDLNQELPPIRASRFGFLKEIKPVIELDANNSFVTNKPVFINGAKLGLGFRKNKFGVGIYQMSPYYLNEKPITSTGTNSKYNLVKGDIYNVKLYMNYNMLFYERVLYHDYRWEFSIPVFYGSGNTVAYVENTRTKTEVKLAESDIYVLSTNLSVHYKIKHWVGIGSGFGYRQILSPQDRPLEKQLSDIYYIVKVKLFLGEVYKGFAKKEKVKQEKVDYKKGRLEEKLALQENSNEIERVRYGIGGTVMFPNKLILYGPHVQVEKPFGYKITGTGSLGLLYGKPADVSTSGIKTSSSTIQIPVLLGSRYYIIKNQKGAYLQANLAYVNTRTNVTSGSNTISSSENTITFGGGAGYQLKKFDFGVRFLAKTEDGLIIRAAYLF